MYFLLSVFFAFSGCDFKVEVTDLPSPSSSIGTLPSTALQIVSITSDLSNGYYGIGASIDLRVTMSGAVTVTGNPTIDLTVEPTQRTATYLSGSGTDTLIFRYIPQTGDTALTPLDYAGINALHLNGASFEPETNLALPLPGTAKSIAGTKTILVKTLPPASPTALTLQYPSSSPGNAPNPVVRVTGPGLLETATLYLDSQCSGSGIASAVLQSSGSGASLGFVDVSMPLSGGISPGVNGIYGTTTDAAGSKSVCSTASLSYFYDNIRPTITQITSANASQTGLLSSGTIAIQIQLNEPIFVTGTPNIALNTTPILNIPYSSGSGTNTLTFNYTIGANQSAALLDVTNLNASSAGVRITDSAGNDALLTLPQGAGLTLGSNRSITISTANPNAPSGLSLVNPSNSPGTVTSPTISVAGVITGHTIKLFTNSTCSGPSQIGSAIAASSTVNLTTTAPLAAGNYQFYANATDQFGTTSSCSTATLAYSIDLTPPSINHITSSAPNGSYGAGTHILIQAVFSEAVSVTGSPVLNLNISPTSRNAVYVSGTGSSTLDFDYTIQSGDSTALIEYTSISSLALNGGTIKDAAGNSASLTLPVPSLTGSLSANKTISIDTTAPTAPTSITLTTPATSPGSVPTPVFLVSGVSGLVSGGANASDSVTLYLDSTCQTPASNSTSVGSNSTNASVTALALTSPGSYTFYANSRDLAGNISNCSSSFGGYVFDNSTPTAPSGLSLFTPTTSPGNVASPTIQVSGLTSGYTAKIYTEATCTQQVASGIASSGTSLNLTTSALNTGNYSFYANQSNPSGTSSPCSTVTLNYVYDNTSPLTPTGVTLVTPATSPGNNPNPVLSVSGVVAGDSVRLFSNSSCSTQVGLGIASSTSVNISSVTLTNGTYAIYANSTDPAGNASSCSSASATYTLNTTPPSAPTNLTLKIPATSPGNQTTPTFTVSGVQVGFIATLHSDSICSSASYGSATASGVNVDIVTSGPLSPGTYNFYANVQDNAGNISSCSSATVTYTLDSTAPSAPSGLSLLTPGTSPGHISTPTLAVSGVISGDVVKVFSDNTCSTQVGLLNPATATTANVVIASPLTAGSTTVFYANSTDPAGNTSSCSTASVAYTYDNTPPNTPSGLSLLLPSTSPGNLTTPTLTVSGVSTGDTVKLFSDATCTTQKGSGVVAAASTTIDIAIGSGLGAGNYSFYANSTDPAGNTSSCSTVFASYSLDTTAPTVSDVTATNANGTYSVGTTLMLQIIFSEVVTVGTSGGTPQLQLNVTPTTRFASYSSGSGTNTLNFTYTVVAGDMSSLLDFAGSLSLSLSGGNILDGAGNAATLTLPAPGATHSLGQNKNIVLDTTPTSAPTTLTLQTPSTSPGSLATPVITIGGVANTDTVKLFTDSACTTQTGSAAVASATSVNITTSSLTPGSYSFYANKTDTLSNISPCSTASLTYVYDNTPPNIPSGLSLITPVASPGNVTSPTLRVSGVVSGDTVKLFSDAACSVQKGTGVVATATTNIDIAATSALSAGTYSFYANSTDPAGNTSSCSSSFVTYTLDTTAPTVTNVTATNANGTYSIGTTLVLQVVFSEVVMVNTAGGTPQIQLNITPSTRSASYSGGSGTNTLNFTYTVAATDTSSLLDYSSTSSFSLGGGTILDTAGNSAVLSVATPGALHSLGQNKSILLDTTAPGLPSALALNTPATSPSNNSTPIVSVSGLVSGDTVKLFTNSSCSTQTGSSVVASSTTALVTTSALTQGTYSFYANSTDPVGNISSCSTAAVTYTYDNTPPSPPSGLALSAPSTSPGNITSPTVIISGVVSGDTVKLFSDATCSTLKGSSVVPTSATTIQITTSVALTPGGYSFYANSTDPSGNVSTCSTNTVAYTLDTTAPTVTNISSTLANGNYNSGIVHIQITTSESVVVTGTPSLILNISPTNRSASYVSGIGTNTLTFDYSIANGDNSNLLDYTSINALQLNGGTLRDLANNSLTLTLPTPGLAGSLSANKSLIIDTTPPTAPSGLALLTPATSPSNNANPILTVSGVLSGDSVRLFADATCLTPISAATTATGTTQNITSSNLTNGSYSFYANSTDSTGNSSSCSTAFVLYTMDNVAPTITSVTSTSTDGSHANGTIVIQILFSKSVTLSGTGTPTLALNTTPAQNATYISGSGSNTLTLNYSITSGDASSRLNYTNATAFALAGRMLQDTAGNSADLTLPTTNGANSLGTLKNIIINTSGGGGPSAPTSLTLVTPSTSPGKIATPTIQVNGVTQGNSARLYSDSNCSTAISSATLVTATNLSVNITLSPAISVQGPITIYANTTDTSSVTSPCSTANITYLYDSVAPTVSDVNSVLPDGFYSLGDSVPIEITFSEPVLVIGIPTLTLNTAPSRTAIYLGGSGTNILEFMYSVVSGDTSTRLGYAATSSLANSTTGTIQDRAGNSATLTLPATNAASSLAVHRNIVIETKPATPSSLALVNPATSPGSILNPTINVVGVTIGNTVSLFTDSSCVTLAGTASASATTAPVTVYPPLTTETNYSFYATQVAPSGTSSLCSTTPLAYSAQPSVSFDLYQQAILEGSGAQSFGLTLSYPLSHDVTVNFDIGNTSAGTNLYTIGPTLTGGTGSVTIPGGQTTAQVPVTILHNSIAEAEKILQLNLANTNYPLVGIAKNFGQSRMFIQDTDVVYDKAIFVGRGNQASHSCGILSSGALFCWGLNSNGQLGNNSTTQSNLPVLIDVGINYSQVAVGSGHTCGLTQAGVLKCWGLNTNGQLGNNSTIQSLLPVVIDSGIAYSQIAAGGLHTCGIVSATGALKCWGNNALGQLGINSTATGLVPTVVDSGTSYSQIALGGSHSCGIVAGSGALKCWGSNTYGQIGNNSTTQSLVPIQIDTGSNYTQIALGQAFSCGLTSSTGALKCWGLNTNGQLGNNSIVQSLIPVAIDSGVSYSQIALGSSHTCGIVSTTGALKCWGLNANGQLGNALTTQSNVPLAIDEGSSYSQITAGLAQSCGIVSTTGVLKCWGNNSSGQIGNNALTSNSLVPNFVEQGVQYSQVALGLNHSCGITSGSGALKCWGNGASGQLGNNSTSASPVNLPSVIDGGTSYSQIAAGASYSCGIVSGTGVLKCWGLNGSGQLGNNSTTQSSLPVVIDAGTSYSQIALGATHTCGIVNSTGDLKCWGLNNNGQLGNNSSTQSNLPVVIDAGTSYSQIALGTSHTCGIVSSTGVLKCWGLNSNGRLGNNSTTQSLIPIVIDAGTSYSQISLGQNHSCGITTAGVLKCWGLNTSGQLGNNSTTQSLVPVVIDTGVSYSQIAAGSLYTCGIVSTASTVKCWGYNTNGQLGNNSITQSLLPVPVDSGTSYGKLAPMNQAVHTCGITSGSNTPANNLKCWGMNTNSQLGNIYRTDIPWYEVLGTGALSGVNIAGSAAKVINITALPAGSGNYGQGQVISLKVQYSQVVTVNTAGGTPSLALNVYPTARSATYTSGTGTNTLTFTYTVQAGDTSLWLDAASYNSLALNGGTITYGGGTAAYAYLPTPGLSGSLSANQLIAIQTSLPSAPTSLTMVNPTTNGSTTINSPTIAVGGVSSGQAVTMYFDSACTQVAGSVVSTGTTVNITTSAPLALGDYTFYANTRYGATSACSTANVIYGYYNATPPVVTSVSSNLPNGTYTTGNITLQITFDRFINIISTGGIPYLSLNTSPSRSAPYVNGTNPPVPAKILNFVYSISSGDTSAKLDEASAAALVLNGGLIQDVAGNTATITLPAPAASNSLGANKNIVVAASGGTVPLAPTTITLSTPTTSPNTVNTPIFTVSGGGVALNAVVNLYTDSNCTTTVPMGTATSSTTSVNVTSSAISATGSYNYYANVVVGGLKSSCSTAYVNYVYDTTIPLAPTLSITPGTFSPSSVHTPNMTVSGILSGDTAQVFTDSLCTQFVGSTVSTNTTAVVTLNPLSAALSYLYANRISGGNTSTCSATPVIYQIQDATVSFNNFYQTVSETSGSQNFGITLSTPLSYPVTVNFDITNTTANSNLYTLGTTVTGGNSSVTIPAGQTTVQVPVTVLHNSVAEAEKLIHLNIQGSNSATVGVNRNFAQSRMYIQDTDIVYDKANLIGKGNQANHSCGILSSGALYCWGLNNYGQLGNNTTIDSTNPVLIDTGTSYSQIALGGSHTCGIVSSTGALKCWGLNNYGQLGNNSNTNSSVPILIDSGTSYSQIALGQQHTCGIVAVTGAMKCWGYNFYGQVGNGTTSQSLSTFLVDTGTSYSNIAAGLNFTCGIVATSGSLKCWGENTYGQLGNNATGFSNVPIQIDTGNNYSQIALGQNHTCGIVATTGALKCWGINSYGQLGNNTNTQSLVPLLIDSGTAYSKIALGATHTCGLVASTGALKCWGYNNNGQLGNGSTTQSLVPVTIDAGVSYSDLGLGASHSCGIVASTGAVKCWGLNSHSQLGNNYFGITSTPIVVDSGVQYSQIAEGTGHSCGIVASTGALKCWGNNTSGQIGNNATFTNFRPTVIDPGTSYSNIALGDSHTCGIVTSTGVLKCWGADTFGQLGIVTSSLSPVIVDRGTIYSQIALGGGHTCGIVASSGVVRCWGSGTQGQLGNNTVSNSFLPAQIDPGFSYSQVALGTSHSCGIVVGTGALRCWGSNTYGQLGQNSSGVGYSYPINVDAGVVYSQVAVGNGHTCGIVSSTGRIKCWGQNGNGQVGNNLFGSNVYTPTSIDGSISYSQLALGYAHSCGIVTTTGVLKCWGDNTYGQLGNNSTTQLIVPTVIDSGTTYSKLGPMGLANHTCAITSATNSPANTLNCWGKNDFGQLANSYRTDIPWNEVLGIGALSGSTIAGSAAHVMNITALPSGQGVYGPGQIISLLVQYSQVVNVNTAGGTPSISLNVYPTVRNATYASGSGSDTLTFNYTVQAGDNSAWLEVASMNSLALNGGAITYGAGSTAYAYLPVPGLSGSLSANQMIAIQSFAPQAPTSLSMVNPASYGSSTISTPTIAVGGVSAAQTVKLYSDSICTQLVGSALATGSTSNVTISSPLALGEYTFYATTSYGATSPCSTASVVYGFYDTSPAMVTSITSNLPNGTYTTGSIAIQISYDRYISVSTLSGIPTLALNTTPTRSATYVSSGTQVGAATKTLNFVYSISTGDISAKLDEASTTALTLNGGVIQDLGGTSVSLSLPAPAASGSLSANNNIVIASTGATVPVSPTTIRLISPASSPNTGTTPTFTVSGGGITNGATVNLYGESSCSVLKGSAVSSWTSVDVTSSILGSPGSYNFYATVVVSGLTSTCSTVSANYVYQSVMPATPNMSLTPATSPSTVRTPTITISALTAGDTAQVFTDSICTQLVGSAVASTTSTIVTLNSLTKGSNYLYANRISGGNQSPCTSTYLTYLIQDATLSLTNYNQSVKEGSGAQNFGLTLSSALSYPLTVNFDLGNSSAATNLFTLGTTLTAGTSSVTIPAGQTSVQVPVTVLQNNVAEAEKSIQFNIQNTTPATVAIANNFNQARMFIQDSDIVYDQTQLVAKGSQASHGCGIVTSGALYCWGNNANGQIGNNSIIQVNSPLLIDAGTSYSKVAVGQTHTCGIVASTGVLKCWGLNTNGQLGNNSTTQSNVPVVVDAGTSYSQVALGTSHTCGIVTSSGALKCWGLNTNGRLGNNSTTQSLVPVVIDSGTSYSQISLGNSHTCGLVTSTGTLKCWGSSVAGQLGNNTTTQSLVPVVIDSGTSYSQVSGGNAHTCGIVASSGILKCWGQNTTGQLGNNSTTQSNVPTVIDAGTSYSQIASGTTHTCGVLSSSGAMKCWGQNTYGQLGNASTSQSLVPVLIDSNTSYSQVTTGFYHSCGIIATTGALKCWGYNLTGQLGYTAATSSNVPLPIDSGVVYSRIALGQTHSCGILSATGALKCWGQNANGQLGINSTTLNGIPALVDQGVSYSQIALGQTHTCGILATSGTLKCWGASTSGQLGNGPSVQTAVPVTVDTGVSYSQIALGNAHSCGIVASSGDLKCWGNNINGQLGNNTNTQSLTPIVIDSGVSYSRVALGIYHTCGIVTSTGALKCWGANTNGQLGNNSTTLSLVPVVIDSGVSYSQIALGAYHTCGIVSSTGALKCWGQNTYGQLGNNSTTQSLVPVVIDSGVSYSQVALGTYHTCGIVSTTGALKCWGTNTNGELGNGTNIQSLLPVLIDSGTSYSELAPMDQASHTCAITSSTNNPANQLKCWGINTSRQLGNYYRSDIPWNEVLGIGALSGGSLAGAAARIVNITALPSGPGIYGPGQVISLLVQFSQSVTVNTAGGTPSIALNVYPTARTANYASGSGTNILTFDYTVASGDNSLWLDAAGYGALSVNGGTITYGGGSNAYLNLPVPGLAGSLSANQLIAIQTITPTAQLSLSMVNPTTNGSTTIPTPTIGVGGVSAGQTVRLYTDSACTQFVGSALSTGPVANITISAPLSLGEYTFYATTSYGATSACSTASVTYAYYNATAPAVTALSATLADGTYTSGSIPIQITFDRYMFVSAASGVPALALNTSPTRYATYVSGGALGSPTKTLNFLYSITAGDTSARLDESASTALILNGGTITDVAGNVAPLTVPAPSATGSLGANKNIVIATSGGVLRAPASLSLNTPATSPGTANNPIITVAGGDITSGNTVNLFSDPTCLNQVGTTVSAGTSANVQISPLLTSPGLYFFYANTSSGGVTSACSIATISYFYAPTVVAAPTTLSLVNPTSSPSTLATPTVSVTGLSGTASVFYTAWLYSDASCMNAIGSTQTTATNTTTVNVTVQNPLPVGTYYLSARQSNSANSFSSCSTVNLTYVLQENEVSLATSFSRVNEGSGTQNLNFSLKTALSYPLTVYYDIYGSTADSSLFNLGGTLGSVTILSGQTSASVALTSTNNGLTEGDKFLQVNITGTSPTSAYVSNRVNQSRTYFRDQSTTYDSFGSLAQGSSSGHSCAIRASGKLYCWGNNSYGQLGQGNSNTVSYVQPVQVDIGTNYSFVAVGADHTCAITSASATPANALKCWGRNNSSQIGDGTTTTRTSPVVIDTGVNYSAVSLGSSHTCGLVSGTGVLKCWGYNGSGQLGDGTNTTQTTPTLVDSGISYSRIAAGGFHTCGLVSGTGVLKCWGYNSSGQLGDGSNTTNSLPQVVDTGVSYTHLSSGLYHSCGVVGTDSSGSALPSGALKCWGQNSYYQLGDGTSNNRASPTAIDSGSLYFAVSSGAYGSCGILAGGSGPNSNTVMKCWGANTYGQTGTGSTSAVALPTIIESSQTPSSSGSIFQVSSYSRHACAITWSGDLHCWGDNTFKQIGLITAVANSTVVQTLVPTPVTPGRSYDSLFLGGGGGTTTTCGILKDSGTLQCWGYNNFGNLGDNTTNSANVMSPKLIDIGTSYTKVTLSQNHSCGIVSSTGILKCWGYNASGELGNNSTTTVRGAVAIDPGTSYSQISVGSSFTCGITSGTGTLKCWGINGSGNLGNNSTTQSLVPIVIDSGTSYSQISLGSNFSCGIVTSTGVLKCWGANVYGQLGNNSNTQSLVPVVIDAGTSYSQIALGNTHTCGIITSTGVLKCWGDNTFGQLGNNSLTPSTVPIVIDPGTSYSKIASGQSHSCGIVASTGAVKCWGRNANGQLGNNSVVTSTVPVLVDSGTAYSQISAGASHTCGLVASTNELRCWGLNITGQLGIGGTPSVNSLPPWLQVLF